MSEERLFGRPAFLLLLCLLGALIWPALALGAPGRVTGRVFHRERIALPRGYAVRVSLQDVSRQDAAAETLAETLIRPSRQMPLPYSLAYDPGRIDPSHMYGVRAQVFMGERLLFTSTRIHPVITRGAPNTADILVTRVAAPRVEAEAAPALEGDWLAVDIGGSGVADGVRSTIRFAANGRVAGRGGCNRFVGSYASSGGTLRLGGLGVTRMACPQPMMEQEARFLAALRATASARVEGPYLTLYDAGGAPLVRLTRM